VASGDNGCNDGIGYFFPCADFPSSSPNVIACGGSSFINKTSETAWSYNSSYRWGGGGAPSLFFNKNSQQNIPNLTYNTTAFEKELQYLVLNNRTTPDIAFNADPGSGWIIIVNGKQMSVGGTSAVSPFMAGYFGLIYNSIKTNIVNNLTAINPMSNYLYNVYNNTKNTPSFVTPFNDITSGTNNNAWDLATDLFKALNGYDLCTGLGSFNGQNLLNYLKLQ
jgi:kumamolisin